MPVVITDVEPFDFASGPLAPPVHLGTPTMAEPTIVVHDRDQFAIRVEIEDVGDPATMGFWLRYANEARGRSGSFNLRAVADVYLAVLDPGDWKPGDILAVFIAPFSAEGEGPQTSYELITAEEAEPIAPYLTGWKIPDQIDMKQGDRTRVIASSPAFDGTIDDYGITPATAGTSIDKTTGDITFTKIDAVPKQIVTVRASNEVGFAETAFQMMVIAKPKPPAENVITVSTMAELQAAMIAARGGQIIEITPGSKVGRISISTAITKSPAITIRPQDRANPPVFKGDSAYSSPFDIRNWNGLILDGLHFDNDLPDTRDLWKPFAVRMTSCSNWKIVDCYFRDWFGFIDGYNGVNVDIGYNTFEQSRCDHLRMYQSFKNMRIHHNKIFNTATNLIWQKDLNRHPDAIQFACTGNNYGCDGVIVEDNFIQTLQPKSDMHGIFIFNERVGRNGAALSTYGHFNMTVRRNFLQGTNCQGIFLGGVKGAIVEQNVMRRAPGGETSDFYTPQVYIGERIPAINDGFTITNNVWPLIAGQTSLKYGIGTGTNITKSGNVGSTEAFPVGWETTDVALGRYGQYAQR